MTRNDQLLGARAVREVLDRHGFTPVRSLGQNFVIDPNTIRKVVDVAALSAEDVVLEVGPGAGSLTRALATKASRVIAIEKDDRLMPVLHDTVGDLVNVTVIGGDVLESELGETGATSLVANLPYNIAARTVIEVLERAPSIRTLTVMTQREVGERLAAGPGSRVYGRTSVLVAYFARARLAAKVSPNAFWPKPNVASVIVRIERSEESPPADRDRFFEVTRAAFSGRRKTLRNSIASVAGSPASAEAALASAGVDPASRAEQCTLDDFARIAQSLTEIGDTS